MAFNEKAMVENKVIYFVKIKNNHSNFISIGRHMKTLLFLKLHYTVSVVDWKDKKNDVYVDLQLEIRTLHRLQM